MSGTDLVRVEGLAVDAEVGVYAHEHGIRQRLVIDLALETDIAAAAAQDALSLAIDYDRVAAAARAVVASQHHALIETIAERIAARVLGEAGPRVRRVFVRVAKPGAVPDARTVAVEIWRQRQKRVPGAVR